MIQQLRTAILVLFAITILTGGVYPLVVTAIAQAAFSTQANGSLIRQDEPDFWFGADRTIIFSPGVLLGQALGNLPAPYNASASSGSNFGPLHPGLKAASSARVSALRAAGSTGQTVPVDLVTASGSGLDPHISPAAAEFQVSRVAASRRMTEDDVRQLIRQFTDGRQLGVLESLA